MRIGLAVALVLAVLPATADAHTLRLHPLRAPVVAADGGRYVVNLRDLPSSAVTVRDERTGGRFTLDAPDCGEPVMGGRRLVMSCTPPNLASAAAGSPSTSSTTTSPCGTVGSTGRPGDSWQAGRRAARRAAASRGVGCSSAAAAPTGRCD